MTAAAYMVRPVMRMLPTPTKTGATNIKKMISSMMAKTHFLIGVCKRPLRAAILTPIQASQAEMAAARVHNAGRCDIEGAGSARAMAGIASETDEVPIRP